jgi:hypothetical protein
MKIGIITNLVQIEQFVKEKMATANPSEWMRATGGNTGNVAFVQGVQAILGDDINVVNWGDNPEAVNKYYDHLVICCANQIGAHVDLAGWADRLTCFDLPVTFIGLGAQSDEIGVIPDVPEGTLKFLEVASKLRRDASSPNIITRGSFTTEVLQSFGYDSAPLGCPSQFICPEKDLGEKCFKRQKSSKYPRIMTAAGNPWHPSAVLEKVLVEIVNKYSGDYILQHPLALFQLASGEQNTLTISQQKRLKEVYSFIGDLDEVAQWFSSYSVFFADTQNWMQYSKHFSLVLGPRYHGVALPIQAGTPGKVIAIDSRTEELSLTTGVPVVKYAEVQDLSADELVESCYWTQDDAENYDNVREQNAAKYIPTLESNGLTASKHLKSLCSTSV